MLVLSPEPWGGLPWRLPMVEKLSSNWFTQTSVLAQMTEKANTPNFW